MDNAALTLMLMSAGITADSKRILAGRNGLFIAMKTVFQEQKIRHAAYAARCRSEIADLRELCARQAAELAALRPVVKAAPSFSSWIPASDTPCNHIK